jgi:hypothetical protein
MEEIQTAMKMHLPWADEIVKGNFPILIRKTNTNCRGFIGVMGSHSFDHSAIFSHKMKPLSYKNYHGKIIGVVEIVGVKKIKKEKIIKKLSSEIGKDYAKWYPTQFIPNDEEVYFWYLKNPKKFTKPFEINRRGGFIWTRFTSNEIEKIKKWK